MLFYSVGYKNYNSMTIMPRLEYCINIIEEVVIDLQASYHSVRKENKSILSAESSVDELLRLDLEKKLFFSLESVLKIQQKIFSISTMTSAHIIVAPLVPTVRIIGAQLFSVLPRCSQRLYETAIYLGSIVLDSAALTNGRLDFSKSNLESQSLLDEVKLIVDSKISKLYPNVDNK